LTKRNIQNGFEVLNEIQAVLDSGEKNQEARLLDLTNKFFTIIPQDFGEERPQPIGMSLPLLECVECEEPRGARASNSWLTSCPLCV
jgi:hypothetical protein